MRYRFLWLAIAGLIFYASSIFVVKDGHPDLKTVGLERHWQGRPFTGVIVGWHGTFRPSLLACYFKGQHHGPEIFWFANGLREREVHYRHGLYEGVSQSWYDNGRIKTWRFYRAGLADGEQWTWGPEGQVLEYNLYRSDQEITHKTWTFDGKPFHNYVYQAGEKVGILGEPFCKRRKKF
jgi:hypothetical protein